MALLDNWITSTLNCITITPNTGTPSTATNSVSMSFSIDVETSGGSISSVSVDYGDGNNETLTAGTAPAYDAPSGNTYASAGKYDFRVTATLATGETELYKGTIVVA